METKKILTEENKKEFGKIWDQKGSSDPFVIMGYEKPSMNYNFYGIAFDPKTNVLSWFDSMQGYVSYTLQEIQELRDGGDDLERIDFSKGSKLSSLWIEVNKSWDNTDEDEDQDENKTENESQRRQFSEFMKNISDQLFKE